MSVPTLYRLTLEMHQLRLLASEKHGRRNVFKISRAAEGLLPSAYANAKTILESKQSKIDQQLSMTKSVLEDYNLSLSPRVAESIVFSTLKQKINEYLSNGIRYRNIGWLKTVLNERVRFDLYLGTNQKYVAIELKILETLRGLRERIGTLSMIDVIMKKGGFSGIIVVYIISTLGGKWFIDEETVSNAISRIPRNTVLVPIVSKADRYQILDTKFLDQLAGRIMEKAKEMLSVK
jgi:hypothetical protein